MPRSDQPPIEQIIGDVLGSSKYRDISPDLIRSIGMHELAHRRNLKEALKATRNKLHQVGGAYVAGQRSYLTWLNELAQGARSDDQTALCETCRRIMSTHASTRERLPLLDQFYATILAELPPVESIIDIACGLHPLSLPWMHTDGIPSGVRYYAYDIYQEMIDFLNAVLPLLGADGHAEVRDVIHACPTQPVDLAFVLKTLPCLEQIEKQAGQHLLYSLNARYLVVSFPAHSLGGRSKGMVGHYEAHFRSLLEGTTWQVRRLDFATELVFIVKK